MKKYEAFGGKPPLGPLIGADEAINLALLFDPGAQTAPVDTLADTARRREHNQKQIGQNEIGLRGKEASKSVSQQIGLRHSVSTSFSHLGRSAESQA